jgi:hypothetical protein
VWPEFNGEHYLYSSGYAEIWQLWSQPGGGGGAGTQALATHTGVSDSYGIPGAYVISGHPGFVQGTDTVTDGTDPRTTVLGPPSHMWAPGSTNGSQTAGITTIEIKLPGLTQYTGQAYELVDCFWSELNNQNYYLQWLRNDGVATRHLLWQDAAFTVPVLPDSMTAMGDYVTSIGGDGSGLWTGYLSSARDGRFVEASTGGVIPEPLTMLGFGMGLVGVGAYFRKRRMP